MCFSWPGPSHEGCLGGGLHLVEKSHLRQGMQFNNTWLSCGSSKCGRRTVGQIRQKCKETSNWCDCHRCGLWLSVTIIICELSCIEFVIQKSWFKLYQMNHKSDSGIHDLAVCKNLCKNNKFCFVYYLHILNFCRGPGEKGHFEMLLWVKVF